MIAPSPGGCTELQLPGTEIAILQRFHLIQVSAIRSRHCTCQDISLVPIPLSYGSDVVCLPAQSTATVVTLTICVAP